MNRPPANDRRDFLLRCASLAGLSGLCGVLLVQTRDDRCTRINLCEDCALLGRCGKRKEATP